MMAKLMRNYGHNLIIGEWLLLIGDFLIGPLLVSSIFTIFFFRKTLFFAFSLFYLWLLFYQQVVKYDN